MLLEDALKEYIFDCEIRNLSKRTIKGYRNNNLRFFEFLDKQLDVIELEKLNSKHIKMYLALLKKQKLSETYINSILKCIRSFLNYCVYEEYIKENPAHQVKWTKEPKVLINTFTDEEIIKMIKLYPYDTFLNARNNTMLITFVETGIRNLELCMIQDIDIRDRDIRVHGKGAKERFVPITPFLKKSMIRYERIRQGYFYDKLNVEDYYFLSRNGKQLTVETNQRILKEIGKRAGVRKEIRCTPHTARHYYAQSQLKNGLDVYSLSRLLGHENITITKRYLQSIKDEEILDMATYTSPLMNLKGGRK